MLPYLLFGIPCFSFVNCNFHVSLDPIVAAPLNGGIDTSEIQRFSVDHPNNEQMTYYTYLPEKVNDTLQILFVMHGKDRNAMDYLDAWKNFADSNNFLIIAPEFPEIIKGETFDYQEGNVWNEHHEWNDKKDWAFSTIERIFDDVKQNNSLITDSFYIFGHSAGAQFVHRMITFLPESRVKLAIAANAGWYTMPNYLENYPYGLLETPINSEILEKVFSKKLVVMLGEKDTGDEFLRNTIKAKDQGKTRLERGKKYVNNGKKEALETLHCNFNWDIELIENIDHNYYFMSKAAQKFISSMP